MGEQPATNAVKLKYSWNEYVKLIEDLARHVRDAGYAPEQVIAIAKGGLLPGDILARLLDVPLGVIAASSYKRGVGAAHDRRGQLTIGENLASVRPPAGRILLVDDLTDHGNTLTACSVWLRERYVAITEVKTAVIWRKTRSSFQPDFCALSIPPDADGGYPWIVQPFEPYEGGFDRLDQPD